MNDKVIIFSGPSLSGIELDDMDQFEFRSPCSQGDVYLAVQDEPSAIAIIDGYFEGQPSVWHKEILYALSEGVHILGASSMGALRAAETHTFGMRGVGAIFEAYRDGEINDDDEVGLVHGPAELGSMPLSEPMVNVRATASIAGEKGALSTGQAAKLCEIAKAQFYKTRTWDTILDALESEADLGLDIVAFARWLTENAMDQKKADALELLSVLEATDFSKPFKADFEFVETEFWHRCRLIWEERTTPIRHENTTNAGDGYRLFDV